MSSGVFVDTSAWYALFVGTDPRHGQAAATYGRLRASLSPLICTDWVLLETAALIHRRIGAAAAREVVGTLLTNTQVSVAWMDEDLGRAAVERYRGSGRPLSLVDCGSFAAMDRLGLKSAFAFDEDFAVLGYRIEG